MSDNFDLNDVTTWTDDLLQEHEDDSDELFRTKAMECQRHVKVKKAVEEAEKKRVEEEAQKRAEEEAKKKAEEEARRRAMEVAQKKAEEVAKARAEAEAKCECPRDAPKTHWRKWEEQALPRGVKKKQVHTKCQIREEIERANNEKANQTEHMLYQSEHIISELEDIRARMEPDYMLEKLARLMEGSESDVEEEEESEEEPGRTGGRSEFP
ncbi:hypothetical protein BU15DRAFT_77905 [Melanogaster broomeanus]|nr:hypothetical protein BU15DRAFT_77905 [Melanogaster broomeanus]